jgi:hypothetical protein
MRKSAAAILLVLAAALLPVTVGRAAVGNGSLVLDPSQGPPSAVFTATFTFGGAAGAACGVYTVTFNWDGHPLGSQSAGGSSSNCQASIQAAPPSSDANPGHTYTVTATTSPSHAGNSATFQVTNPPSNPPPSSPSSPSATTTTTHPATGSATGPSSASTSTNSVTSNAASLVTGSSAGPATSTSTAATNLTSSPGSASGSVTQGTPRLIDRTTAGAFHSGRDPRVRRRPAWASGCRVVGSPIWPTREPSSRPLACRGRAAASGAVRGLEDRPARCLQQIPDIEQAPARDAAGGAT